ncbi:MAG: response regulator [Acidobacteriota bacterium]
MPRVLLVEDEPSIAILEREVLESNGFQVEDVRLGRQALQHIEANDRLALLVLDYVLPDMTGGDIVEALGQRIESLPTLVVTGYPDPQVADRLRQAGISDYIIKDMDLSFLEALPVAARAAIDSQKA